MTVTVFSVFVTLFAWSSPLEKSARPHNGVVSPLSQAAELERQNKRFLALESFSKALTLLENLYVDDSLVTTDSLVDRAIKGMVTGLDPHTQYLSAAQLKEFSSDATGKFGGIGVMIGAGPIGLEIVEVMPASPAQKAGLKTGDVIYSVQKQVVTKENAEEILGQLRGLPGSQLELQILKFPDRLKQKFKDAKTPVNILESDLKTIKLKREIIKSPSVTHASLAPGFAYIRASVFQEDTAEEVDKALRFYEVQSKLEGLVLDLRNNPGGLLDQAIRLVDYFIDSGIVVSTIGRDKSKQEVEFASRRTTHPYVPMVVLVNEGSASASEIVAGALQDHERALVIGSPTFGKGSVQSVVALPNHAGLKMTIARYFTPKGRSIQAKGIIPDIHIDQHGKTNTKNEESKKERDLTGHIEGKDIETLVPNNSLVSQMDNWEDPYKKDLQLRAAYTYLKAWKRLNQTPVQGK